MLLARLRYNIGPGFGSHVIIDLKISRPCDKCFFEYPRKEGSMSYSQRWLVVPVFVVVLAFAAHGYAIELDNPLFHSGITKSGHSGLLYTKGGTSIAPGRYFIGLTPDYSDRDLSGNVSETRLTIPLTFTYGLPNDKHMEIAARIPFVSRDNATSDSGFSEADLSLKWSFLQQEGKSFPSIASGITASFALAGKEKRLAEFEDYRLVFFFSGTALIELVQYREYAFSLYGDLEVILNDWGKDTEEKHGEFNAGVMLPIPNYTNLGFILELGSTVNRGTDREQDIIRIAPAFRANYRNYSFTLGASFIDPEPSGADSYIEYTLSAVIGL
jgi:hypothetical protein